jgi:hypothetical protein
VFPGEPEHSKASQHQQILPLSIADELRPSVVTCLSVELDDESLGIKQDVRVKDLSRDPDRCVGLPARDARVTQDLVEADLGKGPRTALAAPKRTSALELPGAVSEVHQGGIHLGLPGKSSAQELGEVAPAVGSGQLSGDESGRSKANALIGDHELGRDLVPGHPHSRSRPQTGV